MCLAANTTLREASRTVAGYKGNAEPYSWERTCFTPSIVGSEAPSRDLNAESKSARKTLTCDQETSFEDSNSSYSWHVLKITVCYSLMCICNLGFPFRTTCKSLLMGFWGGSWVVPFASGGVLGGWAPSLQVLFSLGICQKSGPAPEFISLRWLVGVRCDV